MAMDLGTLMTLINLCKEAIHLNKRMADTKKEAAAKILSPQEREILRAAATGKARDGVIQIVHVSSLQVLCAGGRQFSGTGYEESTYMDAFESLCRRGLIRHAGMVGPGGVPDAIFRLTGEAFDLDEELRQSEQQQDS